MTKESELKTIDDYFGLYGIHHVRKAEGLLAPLHQPGIDPLPLFEGATRTPFEPQAHAIAACIRMLDKSKRGFLVGEPGSGKTIMGHLVVDEHAKRGVRNHGSNGNYRAMVLCPDHLIDKWKEEIEMTVPGSKVTTFDSGRDGCRVLLGEFAAIKAANRIDGKGGKNSWKVPVGANWYILGRDQAKRLPGWEPAVTTRLVVDNSGSDEAETVETVGGRTIAVERRDVCPKCGRPSVDRAGTPIVVADVPKKLCCTRKSLVELDPSEIEKAEEEDAVGAAKAKQDEDGSYKVGQVIVIRGKKYRVEVCGEPLWRYTRKPDRWPPALYVHRAMRGFFKYLVVDEVHEQGSDEAAQALACGRLIASARYTLALTGTIVGGFADDLFPLLFRFSPRAMIEDGFEWGKQMQFTKKYGRIERVETITSDAKESFVPKKAQSMRKSGSKKETKKSVPGIMPAMFGKHLLGRTVFMSLDDIADNLPGFTEYVGGPADDLDPYWIDCRVDMPPEMATEYRRLEMILEATNKELLAKGSMQLLGRCLSTLLGYTDLPYGWKAPTGDDDHMAVGYWEKPGNTHPSNWIGVVQPADLESDTIYPKEQVMLDIIAREIDLGNQVWVYATMTDTHDVQPRLQKLIRRMGVSCTILRAKSVEPRDRLRWMAREGKKYQVVISNPRLVQTGVDFFAKDGSFDFNAIVFYEQGYSLYILRQAARRAWRISQWKDCRVYYPYYAGTYQERLMNLMSRKMGAATALDGNLNAEGLARMADDSGSAAMALAKSLSNSISAADLSRNWAKVNAKPRTPGKAPAAPVARTSPIILPFARPEPKLPLETLWDMDADGMGAMSQEDIDFFMNLDLT